MAILMKHQGFELRFLKRSITIYLYNLKMLYNSVLNCWTKFLKVDWHELSYLETIISTSLRIDIPEQLSSRKITNNRIFNTGSDRFGVQYQLKLYSS